MPNPGAYETLDQPPYYATLMQRLAALPSVESAGFARYFGTVNTSFTGTPVAFAGGEASTTAVMEYISPNFFATVRIPLLRGRDVTWQDLPSAPKVVLVSESLAKALAPDGDVIGRVIRYGADPAMSALQIVGVVGNVSLGNLRDNTVKLVYMLGTQAGQATFATVHLRVSSDPLSVARPAAEAIASLGREHVQQSMRLDFMFSNSVVAERMATMASSIAAGLALVIACIGVFALLSHAVQRRTREIGIRVAVGARPGTIARLVLRDALVVVSLGLGVGLPAAMNAAALVRSLLFDVTTSDTVMLTGSAVLLVSAAVAGAALPTLRAVRVDPTVALRAE